MFDEIIKKIEAKEYIDAKDALVPLTTKGGPKDIAIANYLLGYIYTCYDNPEEDEQKAKRYLHLNLTSDYPHPYAYYLYARVEKDKNIALNYLRIGVSKYPKNPDILKELLWLSPDKEAAIQLIDSSESTDPSLLGHVISYLIEIHQWERIQPYLKTLSEREKLNNREIEFLGFLNGYSLIFRDVPNASEAEHIFRDVISLDKDNDLAYAHYLGLIYSCIIQGKKEEAISWFDRLPVNNTIHDFFDRPRPFGFTVILEKEYSLIFNAIGSLFSSDSERKLTSDALYALYLYNPSEDYDGMYRYKKSDASVLTRYLKRHFNSHVAHALYNMRLHFNQYKEAYKALIEFIKNYTDWGEEIYDLPFRYAKEEELSSIIDYTVECLKDDDFDRDTFVDDLFSELIQTLHRHKLYAQARNISDYIPNQMILKSDCSFECAFAYGEINHDRASLLYKEIIKQNPQNSSAINNLGVQYEHKENYYEALALFEKALSLDPKEEIYSNNVLRMQKTIGQQMGQELFEIADSISSDALEEIGYNIRINQRILTIQDEGLRKILLRDLKECAIAVVAGQDKMATIMCGSIIEALLMQKIRERSIDKYDISQISKSKHATSYPVVDMGLNELLFVADQEKILDKNSYHLGHYIRDYRNIVHPAKEKRMSEEVSHENVLTMWAVLKRLLEELY